MESDLNAKLAAYFRQSASDHKEYSELREKSSPIGTVCACEGCGKSVWSRFALCPECKGHIASVLERLSHE